MRSVKPVSDSQPPTSGNTVSSSSASLLAPRVLQVHSQEPHLSQLRSAQLRSSQPHATLSLFDAIAIIVGLVIGAGIFKTPSIVAQNVSSEGWLIGVWLIGGLISLVGALTYAELATAYPNTGGDYHYLHRAYGEHLSFLFAWARITVIQPGSIALLAFVFGDYATALFALGPNSSALYAGFAVVLLTGMNVIGIRESKWTQNVLTVLEVCGLLVVIVAGLFLTDSAATQNLAAPSPQESANPEAVWQTLGFALVSVLLTFGGWNEAAYISAEVRDGRRNMVRALIWSIFVLTGLYLLVNLALLRGLGLAGVRSSQAVAADLIKLDFGARGAYLMSVIVAVSALTSANATVLTGARTNYALGRDFSLFNFLGRWNNRVESPINALLVQGSIALALVFAGAWQRQGFEQMIGYTAPVFWFFFLLTGIALFVLRRKEPLTPRPFRVPLFPVTPLLFCLSSAYMLSSSINYYGSHSFVGIFALLAGIPVLLYARRAARGALPAPNY